MVSVLGVFSFSTEMFKIARSFQTSAARLDKTLFVRNIAWSVTENDLASAFGQHGQVLRYDPIENID